MLEIIKKFGKNFKVKTLIMKLPKYIKIFGIQTIYSILLLYNAFKRKETPSWAKNIIIGTLGYLISPIDSIPDVTPFLGYTDDLGVLSFGLVTISCYINNEIKDASKNQLGKWFKQYDEKDLIEIDSKL
jgi:uncharacterized membrane protein YkvA (DUF1232 family)